LINYFLFVLCLTILLPLFVLTQKVEQKSQGKSNCSAAFATARAPDIEVLGPIIHDEWLLSSQKFAQSYLERGLGG